MLLYLHAFFVGLLILSNILAVKIFSIAGFAYLPAAVLFYVFTYPITDIVCEVYGGKVARRMIYSGSLIQFLATMLIYGTIQLPPAPFFMLEHEFEAVLGPSIQITGASLLSFLVSQHLDVHIFQRLKADHGEKKLWLRSNLSTTVSQLVDTTLFITIAFYGTMPIMDIVGLIVTQYGFKLLASFLLIPLVYVLVYVCKKEKRSQPNLYA